MAQLIYAISALGIVVLVAVSMQTSSTSNEMAVYRNEVRTQLVSIGRDIVDEIGRQNLPFDEKVDPNRLAQPANYPYVHSAGELTATDSFGGCSSDFSTCLDIDDFHFRDGDTKMRGTRNGLDFTASIEVRYVAEVNPRGAAGTKTFAKEIIVTVESESIQIDATAISATYNRVITYPRITNYAY